MRSRSSSRTSTAYLRYSPNSLLELSKFSTRFTRHSLIHEDMKRFFDGYPSTAHPMAILSSMVCSLSSFYPDALDVRNTEILDMTIARLLAKVRTIAAFSYKKSVGQPFVYPQNSLSYCANFLNMMFSVPAEPYEIDEDIVKVLNLLLILHADHEQNCSTSTVGPRGERAGEPLRLDFGGDSAPFGVQLHGGANQEVVEMLRQIRASGGDVKKFVEMAKDKTSNFRLMGFGHRVYKNHDLRARMIKVAADKALPEARHQRSPPRHRQAPRRNGAQRQLLHRSQRSHPNVDFYSGITYGALGFPTNMFTVMFALGRPARMDRALEGDDRRLRRRRSVARARSTPARRCTSTSRSKSCG